MIHLKIISANFPNEKKPLNPFFKIIPQHENNTINPTSLYKSKKKKKTNDPEWDDEFYIPFYCFDSLVIEFWNKKIIGEDYIGKGQIFLNPENLNQNSQQTFRIDLNNSSNNFQSFCQYSILPTMSSLNFKNTETVSLQVYMYLTYDPPLRSNEGEEVHLFVQSVNANGTVFERVFENQFKTSKNGPSGTTDIFIYDAYFSNETSFFYVKSINYTGKISLNIANAPYPADMGDLDQYFLFTNDISILVDSRKNINISYSIFPIKFTLIKKLTLTPFSIPQGINPQKVSLSTLNEKLIGELFESLFNFYHSNPDGIALKTILDCGSRGICPPNLSFHYRCLIEKLNKYSIKNSYKFHEIESPQTKIVIAFQYHADITNNKVFIFTSGANGENLNNIGQSEAVCKYDNNEIGFINDMYKLCFSPHLLDKSVKCVSIVFSSDRNCSLNSGACRLVDMNTRKELMFLDARGKITAKSVLVGIFVKSNNDDDDDWEFWPCLHPINGSGEDNAFEFLHDFLIDDVHNLFK